MIDPKVMIVGSIYGPTVGALPNAVNWVSDLLFGPLATTVAVIAIAWSGFSMLWGRINLRRGQLIVLGCFLLFGARVTADGLRLVAVKSNLPPKPSVPPPQPAPLTPLPSGNNSNAFDPYAGKVVSQSER